MPLLAMSLRRWLLAVGGASFLIAAVVGTKGYQVFAASRATQRPPAGVHSVPAGLARAYPLEAVSYDLERDIAVAGWYVPSKNGAAVLFVHGQPGTRKDLVPEAQALAAAGFGALLIDLPGHGESTGKATWGEPARQAIRRGLDYLARRCDVSKHSLGLFGFSYGSSLAAYVATDDRRVRALVLAGPFTSARAQIEYAYDGFGGLSVWPAIWGAEWDGLALDSLRTRDVIASVAPTPLLFIAGTRDIVVPESMTRDVFEHAREPKQYLLVEGAGHGQYGEVMGRPYFQRLVRFFRQYLAPAPPAQKREATGPGPDCIPPGRGLVAQ